MKISVKTLKGEKFDVTVEPNHTIMQVKETIESQKAELIASTLKLIHSGKILKDDDVISTCGIKENDFLVVMVTKAKKVAAAPKDDTTAAAAASATSVAPPVVNTTDVAPAAATDVTGTAPTPTNAAVDAASTTTPAPTSTSATTTVPDAPRPADAFPDDIVTNLTSMGFPEAEVRHCLRAAHGNPDVAVEFLTNGIPDGVAEAADLVQATNSSTATPSATTTSATTTRPLQALRNHPQFNALRRLVQSNPGALQQVLTQIGQQQPDLLAEINANQATFLEMMNEPIPAVTAPTASSGTSSRGLSSLGGDTDANAMMMDELGGGNPAQMAQMIQSMSAEELQQMAGMMGISADQLRDTARMIGQMPPEQLNQFMMQAMAGGGGMDGMMGGGDGPAAGGQHVLRLTEEEMAAVDRLADLGFDRSEAAQAFLACDKNEALAANLLMDSMANGGFFGGDDDNNNNNGGNNNGDDDDVDNMYD